MRSLAIATVVIALSLGPATTLAADEEAPATGGFGPGGSFTTLRGGHDPVLLQDGRVLYVGGGHREAEAWDPATGSFSPAGSLPKRRWNHSTTLLPDGRVLVVGGMGVSQRPLAGAKVWEPATASFSPAGSLAEARDRHAALLLGDGRVLIVGGCCTDDGLGIAAAEIWDPATNRFRPAGALSEPREDHTVTLLPDDRVLVIGGATERGWVATAEVWDPATESFASAGEMTEARAWHDATLLADGRVLIAGGEGETAEVWDPATGSFSPTGSPGVPRADGYTTTLLPDGRVLLIGGVDYSCGAEDCPLPLGAEVWEPATGSFAPAGSLAEGRADHSAMLLPDGRVLVVGGRGEHGGPIATAEVWDPATETFGPTGAPAVPRGESTATLLTDGRVLVAGGVDEDGFPVYTAEVWDPVRSTTSPAAGRAISLGREDAEAALLEGIRHDVADTCKPLRKGLPESALAGIDCRPKDPAAKWVRVFLLPSADDLLDAYFDRLEDNGLDPGPAHHGRCQPGRSSEGPYHPTLPQDRPDYPYRSGCFIDDAGRAHYLGTSPPHVLIEVTGTSGSISAVENYAWRGNEDVPGGPTIW